MEGADKEFWVASHSKGLNDLGQGNFMSALIEIEDAVLSTVRRVIGLNLVRVDIYLCDWLRCFLTGRTQRVRVGSALSASTAVLSGVPQGSVLGPLLFALYVDDLFGSFKTVLPFAFADDLKLIARVPDADSVAAFQSDVRVLEEWCAQSLLEVNLEKTRVLHFGRGNSHADYFYGLNRIGSAESVVDLGVRVDTRLDFSAQADYSAKRAFAALGAIRRAFCSRDQALFTRLYR